MMDETTDQHDNMARASYNNKLPSIDENAELEEQVILFMNSIIKLISL